jgi:hypothetical protein
MTANPRAQLGELLDRAEKLATGCSPAPWSSDPTGTVCADADLRPDGNGGEILPPEGPSEVAECYRNERPGERGANAAHIALWDPRAVGRLIERDRGLLADFDAVQDVDHAWGRAETLHGEIARAVAFWAAILDGDRD